MIAPATWSQSSLDYFGERAIDPEVAAELGVRESGGAIVFPISREDGSIFERRRALNGSGPKVMQPKAEPLVLWWPAGRPETGDLGLICEGESDALAALSALAHSPDLAALRDLPVVAIPGTGWGATQSIER
jgi:hypothetical protein